MRLIYLMIFFLLTSCSTPRQMLQQNVPATPTPDWSPPPHTEPQTIIPTATEPILCQVNADGLHLRQAPDPKSIIVDWLVRGDQLRINSRQADKWQYVTVMSGRAQGQSGYVNSDYMECDR
jgi:hypothetical protein